MHFQRFGECLRLCKEKMDAKNIYLTNPAFDKQAAVQPQPRLPVRRPLQRAARLMEKGRAWSIAQTRPRFLYEILKNT